MQIIHGSEYYQSPHHERKGLMSAKELYVTVPWATRVVTLATKIPLNRLRDSFITSTNFAKIIGIDQRISPHQLLQIKLGRKINESTSTHTRRGIELEDTAFKKFENFHDKPVFKIDGYILSKMFTFLACSPDGITSDGTLIEIKCPLKFYDIVPRVHFAQMQFDMYVTGASSSYYVQLVNDIIRVSRVYADTAFIHDHLEKVVNFYSMLEIEAFE